MAGFEADVKLERLVLSIIDAGATAFVETGTGQGDSSNAVARQRGVPVLTCDVDPGQIEAARKLLPPTVEPALMSSEKFIPSVRDMAGDLPLFFLDAHWRDYWPLLDELKAIGTHYDKAVIVVHDFRVPGRDADFGYCVGGGGTVGVTRTAPGEGVNEMAYIEPVLRGTGQRYRFFYPGYEPPDKTPGYVVIYQNTEPVGDLDGLSVTVLVSTVDEYEALWPVTCFGLKRFWPDCPWPVVWYSNTKKVPYQTTIKTGKDRNWATMTRVALSSIGTPVVLLMMDDVWLWERVDTAKLKRLAGVLLDGQTGHLQLQSPFGDGRREVDFNDELYFLPEGVLYRASLQPAFWRKDVLLEMLRDDDQIPGDFEGRSWERAMGGRVLAVRETGIEFVNATERGRWTDAAFQYAQLHGLDVDFSKDPMGGF